MEKAKIGAILKNRIYECGYSQEKFAEVANIGYSTLKNYLSGKNTYTYEQLKTFAKLLDCSYEYLLGESDVTKKEYEDMKSITGFDNITIEKLYKLSREKSDYQTRKKLETLQIIIKDEELLHDLAEYMFTSQYTNLIYKTIGENILSIYNSNMSDENKLDNSIMPREDLVSLVQIVNSLSKAKVLINSDLKTELKKNEKMENDIKQLETYLKALIGGKIEE